MNKYFLFIIMAIAVCLTGCDDFLDTKDLINKNDQNFPTNETDFNQALVGCYNSLAMAKEGSIFLGSLSSDDQFGGGAANDYDPHGLDKMETSTPNMVRDLWLKYYAGIYRVNKMLESVEKVSFSSENNKNNMLGQAYFLRAFFYSELIKVFGEVPLVLKSEPQNLPKSSADAVYAQVSSDLTNAINMLPSVTYNKTQAGRITKWAAEGLMARVFLFYTGYYQKQALPMNNGKEITKEQIIKYLEDVISNSGHVLIKDFRNLWPYTHPLMKEDYSYTRGKHLMWAGESNSEVVLSIKYGNFNSWSEPYNAICQDFGIRGQSNKNNCFPFGDGYGLGSVNPNFIKNWEKEEPDDSIRLWGSVIDVDNPREGIKKYELGGWNMFEETKLFIKKYSLIYVWTDKTNPDPLKWKSNTYNVLADGQFAWMQTGSLQELILMRYSDILLMHSELTQTANGINTVRARVGLPPIQYSFDNLVKERHHELAFEGLRYYDLLRWYRRDAGKIIDANQNGADIYNDQVPGKYKANLTQRIADTGGFLQIPESEILLSGKVLTQNKGW